MKTILIVLFLVVSSFSYVHKMPNVDTVTMTYGVSQNFVSSWYSDPYISTTEPDWSLDGKYISSNILSSSSGDRSGVTLQPDSSFFDGKYHILICTNNFDCYDTWTIFAVKYVDAVEKQKLSVVKHSVHNNYGYDILGRRVNRSSSINRIITKNGIEIIR